MNHRPDAALVKPPTSYRPAAPGASRALRFTTGGSCPPVGSGAARCLGRSLASGRSRMGRIRTIKPEFFTSADVCGCSHAARLLFLALFCEADRAGRLAWKPDSIRLRYFPADPKLDVAALAAELETRDMLRLYEAEGRWYAWVVNFSRHQHINGRETESRLPPPPPSPPPGPPSSTSPGPGRSEGPLSTTQEGKGRERPVPNGSARVDDTSPRVDDIESVEVLRIPLAGKAGEHVVTDADVLEYRANFPALDVMTELRKCRQWNLDNPTKRKTKTGIRRHIGTWLGRAQDRGGTNGHGAARRTPQQEAHDYFKRQVVEIEAEERRGEGAGGVDGDIPF